MAVSEYVVKADTDRIVASLKEWIESEWKGPIEAHVRTNVAEEIAQAIEKRATAVRGVSYEDHLVRVVLKDVAALARQIGARRD